MAARTFAESPAARAVGYGVLNGWSFVFLIAGFIWCFSQPIAGSIIIFTGAFVGTAAFALRAYSIRHSLTDGGTWASPSDNPTKPAGSFRHPT